MENNLLQALLQSASVFAAAVPLLVAGIFAVAGFSKLKSDNQSFYQRTIDNYGVTPAWLSPVLPRVIGSAEVLICLLVLLPAGKAAGLYFAAVLLSVYLLAFAKQLWQGKRDMDCGCAGPGANIKISPMLLARNAALIALCIFAASAAPQMAGVWILTLCAAAVLGLVYVSADQLIANHQKITSLRDAGL